MSTSYMRSRRSREQDIEREQIERVITSWASTRCLSLALSDADSCSSAGNRERERGRERECLYVCMYAYKSNKDNVMFACIKYK